jgi:hypothetical protein
MIDVSGTNYYDKNAYSYPQHQLTYVSFIFPVFPLQSNILPIKLNFPRGREMDRAVICIDPHFTGFHLPVEGANRLRENVPYLSLVPRISSERAPAFLDINNAQMRNKYMNEDANRQSDGNKMVESAAFTIIYIPEYIDGLAVTYPFLFLIMTTLLQWLVHTPDKVDNSHMLGLILQLKTAMNNQKTFIDYNNKLSQVIYLTYVIISANILTLALMAYREEVITTW